MTSETATVTPAALEAPAITAAPVDLHGERQRQWTLMQMLREPVRDLLAERGRDGTTAVVLGCGSGRVARHLLELGFDSVLGLEDRSGLLADAEASRDELGISARSLRLAASAEAAPARAPAATAPGAAFVLIEDPAGAGGEQAALQLARRLGDGPCAILTIDRLGSRERARAAGFERVSLIQPPADAERSLVLLQLTLLVARPPAGGESPAKAAAGARPAPGETERADG